MTSSTSATRWSSTRSASCASSRSRPRNSANDQRARALLAYEATADFPLEDVTIDCWSGPTEVQRIAGRKVTVVPILRAGLACSMACST